MTNTYKRTLLVRNADTVDWIDLVIETDTGDIPLRIPVELLNSAITGLFAGAHALSQRRPAAPPQPNQATVAAPFFVERLATHAEAPGEAVLTAQCGPATLALHLRPEALRAALAMMEQAARTVSESNRRPH